MLVQVQVGNTRARSVNFSLLFKNDEIKTQRHKYISFVSITFYANAAAVPTIQKRRIVLPTRKQIYERVRFKRETLKIN